MSRIFIVADHLTEAIKIASNSGLKMGSWYYLDDTRIMKGFHEGSLWLTGNFSSNPIAANALQEARLRNMNVMHMVTVNEAY